MDHHRNLEMAVGNCKTVSGQTSQDDLRMLAMAATEVAEWTVALVGDVNNHDKRIKAIADSLERIERRLETLERSQGLQ